ncbi:hypothetical protein CLOP_g15575 [Closterium sp. NIES-67]|nr:hypothetical protein CLOP_g15575 [Closterium sp. NIES-67]
MAASPTLRAAFASSPIAGPLSTCRSHRSSTPANASWLHIPSGYHPRCSQILAPCSGASISGEELCSRGLVSGSRYYDRGFSHTLSGWKGSSRRGGANRASGVARAADPSGSSQAKQEFSFTDEGPSVEIRVPIPSSLRPIQSRHVAVKVEEDALAVAVAPPAGFGSKEAKERSLLVARPLYGRVKASESVWYIDDAEIVITLVKQPHPSSPSSSSSTPSQPSSPTLQQPPPAPSEPVFQAWPTLLQGWAALTEAVANQLKSCSVLLVGGSSCLNAAVAAELATGLGYAPMVTQQLVEQLASATIDEVAREEGPESVAQAETALLDHLSSTLRVVVATMGQPYGASLQADSWRFIHGGIALWLDVKGDADSPPDPHFTSRADVAIRLHLPSDWTTEDGVSADVARAAAEGALTAVKAALDADPQLPGKKSLYVRMGCRGDWPDLMPPSWDPSAENNETSFGGGEDSK